MADSIGQEEGERPRRGTMQVSQQSGMCAIVTLLIVEGSTAVQQEAGQLHAELGGAPIAGLSQARVHKS